MAEVNTPRLMAAAKEFNIGKDTLIDYLLSKGFEGEDLKPTSRISEEMYRILQVEFQTDKAAKQKAEQIDLPKNAVTDYKKRRDEQDLSFNKKEAPKPKETPIVEPPVEEIPVIEPVGEIIPEPPLVEPVPEQKEPEIIKIEAPEMEQPKVIDKIDLSTIDSSTRPKKGTTVTAEKIAKKEEVEEEVKEKQVEPAAPQLEQITEEETHPGPVKAEPVVITNIKAEKLEGPKILGKIVLPVNNDTRPKPSDERRKRKRIVVEKKPTTSAPNPSGNFQRPQAPRPPGRFNRNAPIPTRREEKEIDQKEIQDKIKETQAKLAGSGGRGKSLKAKYRKAKREEAAENVGEDLTDNKLQVTEFISVSE
ncbi:MAG: translation initiation factor IF-2, partial [Bacteroidota bacterium]|nr:translation initiation factor IF-2 [Bacteroidota bacterium]